MSKIRRGPWLLVAAALLAAAGIVLTMAWSAGGSEEIHEISVPVAVPELPR